MKYEEDIAISATMSSTIPDKYRLYFDISDNQISDLYELLLSIELYLLGKISLSKAADLCDHSVEDFISELRKRKINRLTGYETVGDLEGEQESFSKYAKDKQD